jgi:glycosyltransferase involved in cell wall biosynthesis
MRLLFVVQRYGADIAGGAEQACREVGTRLAARGHQVEVLTSCARSYVDWANAMPSGTERVANVDVHRLPVARPRDNRVFSSLNPRVVGGTRPVPWHLQLEWMRQQGPFIPELAGWLTERASSFDAVVFFTYLYYTTWAGLPVASRLAPTLLVPTAHDEPPLRLELFDPVFRHAHTFGFLTPEESAFVARRFRISSPSMVLGLGVDLDGPTPDADAFRATYGLGERPYVACVGRLDPHKGTDELYAHFLAYKRRNPSELALVFVGEQVKPLQPHDDVFFTGFVDEQVRSSALAGCLALVHPGYFESFSMVLSEAWALSRPALVQGHSAVLDGQARRSGGGIAYRGFAELEAALDMLVADPLLADSLGSAGRRYVEAHYRWDHVLDRYERLLGITAARGLGPV